MWSTSLYPCCHCYQNPINLNWKLNSCQSAYVIVAVCYVRTWFCSMFRLLYHITYDIALIGWTCETQQQNTLWIVMVVLKHTICHTYRVVDSSVIDTAFQTIELSYVITFRFLSATLLDDDFNGWADRYKHFSRLIHIIDVHTECGIPNVLAVDITAKREDNGVVGGEVLAWDREKYEVVREVREEGRRGRGDGDKSVRGERERGRGGI